MPRFVIQKLADDDPTPDEVPGTQTVCNLRVVPDAELSAEEYLDALQRTPGIVPNIMLPFVLLLTTPTGPP